MQVPDHYLTIEANSTGTFKDRGSRFIACLMPVADEEEAREQLKHLRKEHHAATHHCWALRVDPRQPVEKSSDDGEPSGTAGRPILGVLQSEELCNVMCVVVRYFGGKQLGVPGLIHAYGEATREAVLNAKKIQCAILERCFAPCSYEKQHEMIRLFKQFSVKFYPGFHIDTEGFIFEVAPSGWADLTQVLKQNRFEPQLLSRE